MSIIGRLQKIAVFAAVAATALACSAPPPGETVAAATSAATSGDARASTADAIVARWVDAERIPGAVLLVSRAGEVTFEKPYGYAQLYEYGAGEYGAAAAGETRPDALHRLDAPVPMGADTVFDLASVTKVMATTFAVMLLVDDGTLELDAPLSRYLTDFGAAKDNAAGDGATIKRDITLRQLLTHRAGLSQWQPIYYSADNAADAYAFIRDFPLTWRPGAGRHYSDLGFMLLGVLVERVSGQSLDAFLQQRLYGPLGLSATGFRRSASEAAESGADPTPAGRFAATSHGNPFEHHMVHDPDFGYRIDIDPDSWNGWRHYTLVGEVNDGNAFHVFGGIAGHAGLFSTAADLQVLLQLLLESGEHDGTRYVSADTVNEFLTATGDAQALGWQVPDYLPAGSFVHTGFTGTYVAGVPSENLAIVLLTNRQNVGLDEQGQYSNLGELQREVASALAAAR